MQSEYNYKEVWNYAMEQISQEYKELGQESEFKLWFNIEYIEDTIDTIKVSAPSEFMWNRMVEKGNISKICDKIKEITGQQNISIVSVITNKIISNEPTPKTEISAPKEKEEDIFLAKLHKYQPRLLCIYCKNPTGYTCYSRLF